MRYLVMVVLAATTFPSSVSADVRYRIRPRLGELVEFEGRCGPAIQVRLWQALAKIPIVTVRENATVDIDFRIGSQIRASREVVMYTGKRVNYWDAATPGFTFVVTIKERPLLPPRIEVAIIRDIDTADQPGSTWCSEKWVGIGDKF